MPDLGATAYRLELRYAKDHSVVSGLDRVFVDDLRLVSPTGAVEVCDFDGPAAPFAVSGDWAVTSQRARSGATSLGSAAIAHSAASVAVVEFTVASLARNVRIATSHCGPVGGAHGAARKAARVVAGFAAAGAGRAAWGRRGRRFAAAHAAAATAAAVPHARTRQAVVLRRANDGNTAWEQERLLFFYEGQPIREIDLAFEQNARPVVCAERPTGSGGAPEVWLYRFDPAAGRFTFEPVCGGRTPRLVLDDPHDPQGSDVLLFYVSDENDRVEVRQQRDLYRTVYPTPLAGAEGLYLERVAKARDSRLHVVASRRDPATGRYTLDVLESTLYPLPHLERFEARGTLAAAGDLRTALFIAGVNEPFVLRGTMLPAGALREPVIVLGPLYDGERFTLAGRLSGAGSLADVYRRLEHTTGAEAFTLGGRMRPDVGSLTQVMIVRDLPGGETFSLAGTLQTSGSLTNV